MEKIQKIAKILKEYNPNAIYLFGSRARGDNLETSDIDIAIDIKLGFREKRKLKEKIDKAVGLYSVDLVFLDETTQTFREKILKEGIKL